MSFFSFPRPSKTSVPSFWHFLEATTIQSKQVLHQRYMLDLLKPTLAPSSFLMAYEYYSHFPFFSFFFFKKKITARTNTRKRECQCRRPPHQIRQEEPHLSSSFLRDAIYRSMEESNSGGECRETTLMTKKQNNSVSSTLCDAILGEDKEISNLGQAIMVESWADAVDDAVLKKSRFL